MKRTFFRNSIIFSVLIFFVVSFISIGYAALTKIVSISSKVTFYQAALLRQNTGTPQYFLGCPNIPSTSVKKLYFRASFPDTAVETCDVSEAQDGSAIAYLKSNGTVYVVGINGMVYANTRTKFANLENCSVISFADSNGKPYFNTKKLVGMNRMFQNLCSSSTCSMTKLDLTCFDTSKVTDFGEAFLDASKVQEIDVSSFDTSKGIYMYGTFNGCSSLTSLNLSSWNTSKVATMESMFKNTSNLSNVYVSNLWSTANIGDPQGISSGCGSQFRCNGLEMFTYSHLAYPTGSTLAGNHPYSPCYHRSDAIFGDLGNYAKIDGGPSSPGCLDDVSNMPTN